MAKDSTPRPYRPPPQRPTPKDGYDGIDGYNAKKVAETDNTPE